MYEQYSTVTKAKIMTWARAHLGVARVVDAGVAQQGEDGEEGVANLKKLFLTKLKILEYPYMQKHLSHCSSTRSWFSTQVGIFCL